MPTTPAHRTLKALQEAGHACLVERWIPNTNIRKDAFGFGDILAIINSHIYLVQAYSFTSGNGRRQHFEKIRDDCHPEAADWLICGGRIQLWGWRRLKTGWEPVVDDVTLSVLRKGVLP